MFGGNCWRLYAIDIMFLNDTCMRAMGSSGSLHWDDECYGKDCYQHTPRCKED